MSLLLSQAKLIADGLVTAFSPACHRIEIAGSVRRGKPVVGDIELVAIPKTKVKETGQSTLFGESPTVVVNLLHQRIFEVSDGLRKIRPIKPGSAPPAGGMTWLPDEGWEAKKIGESRYWRLWIPRHRVKVDLFLATPETWGAVLAIRTGPADYSAAMVRRWTAVSGGGHFHQGRLHPPADFGASTQLYVHGVGLAAAIETPEERDVFEACEMEWVEPESRR